jgi:hypothetical protein
VFKIKPAYKSTREARIKKKRPDEFPKDSVGILELGKEEVVKVAKVRSYKTPKEGAGWVAYLKERETTPARAAAPTQKTVDSLKRTIDSLMLLVVAMHWTLTKSQQEVVLPTKEATWCCATWQVVSNWCLRILQIIISVTMVRNC